MTRGEILSEEGTEPGGNDLDWAIFAVQWLHVLLGMFWFGNALSVAVFLIPSLNPLPIQTQREVGGRYGAIADRVINVIAPVVVILGFLRGGRAGGLGTTGAVKVQDDDFGDRLMVRSGAARRLRHRTALRGEEGGRPVCRARTTPRE